ncbi:MAG: AEC family transporter [Desulfosarcinaceae bacterium]
MILRHLFPVFALLVLGVVLKRTGMIDAAFSQTADKLIYYLFFPLLLFWKIGAAPQVFSTEALRFYASAVLAVLVLYLLSLLSIKLFRIADFQAGAFSQSCYRFNTYVGMAVIFSVLGESGVAQFGVLIGMVIPLINILSVMTLIWFSKGSSAWSQRLRISLSSIIRNPLIIGCLAGILYARWINTFPPFLENTFRLAGSVTLPLALISIGGSLTLGAMRQHFPRALAASMLKLAVLPLCGFWLMRALTVPQQLITVGLIFFALPTSTAVYVLSAQLGSDKQFASSAIVLSTALSFASLSVVLWWHYG